VRTHGERLFIAIEKEVYRNAHAESAIEHLGADPKVKRTLDRIAVPVGVGGKRKTQRFNACQQKIGRFFLLSGGVGNQSFLAGGFLAEAFLAEAFLAEAFFIHTFLAGALFARALFANHTCGFAGEVVGTLARGLTL